MEHLHVVQSPLHEHLINSLQALETSGIVIQTGNHIQDSLTQPKSWGEGTTC